MRSELQMILGCMHCRLPFEKGENNRLVCRGCGAEVAIKGGRPCFGGTEVNAEEGLQGAEAKDRSKWTSWRKKNYEFFQRKLKSVPRGAVILDLGSGPAQFSTLFEPFRTFRTDFFPYSDCDFLSDINQPLPILDNSLDVVYMSNVLEHVREPNALLAECHRVLKPGGKLLLTVPFFIKIHQAPYDFQRYTVHGLDALLQKASFNRFEIEPIGDIFDVYASIQSGLRKNTLRAVSGGGPRQLLAKALLKAMLISFNRLLQCIGDDRGQVDPRKEFAHGYGLEAEK